jgi:hypothetical protein
MLVKVRVVMIIMFGYDYDGGDDDKNNGGGDGGVHDDNGA